MIDLKTEVVKALKRACGNVSLNGSKDFVKMPCISYFEISNTPANMADDREYLTEIEYAVDIWGEKDTEVTKIALRVNAEMASIGFVRSFSYDVAHEKYRHKTMRFNCRK